MQATRTRASNSNSSAGGDKMSREIDAIKQGLGELRNDVTELLNHAVGVGKGGAEVAKERASDAMDRLKEKFSEMKDRGADSVNTVQRRIQQSPFRSVLIAFGAGYIFAKLSSRR